MFWAAADIVAGRPFYLCWEFASTHRELAKEKQCVSERERLKQRQRQRAFAPEVAKIHALYVNY